MPTIFDYYKYSMFSTAAYVRLGSSPWTGSVFTTLAATQERLPTALGKQFFNPN